MDNNSHKWWTVAIVIMAMAIFLILSVRSYVLDLKDIARKFENDVNEKSNQLVAKDQELAQKAGEITTNQQELARRLEEVRKLQGSVKTVGRCLIGTLGAIDALQKNDENQARQALFLIQSTCEQSSAIIKEIESYETDWN